jgi:hypothetical protein
MAIRRALTNGLLLLVALGLGLLLSEVGARLLLNPADYLSATTVSDDILGLRIAPGAPGFDAWGFRNPRVPASVDIVALGDSHTYGNNAAMAESWPAVVGRLTGRSVYNLGLGGYGPNQYYHLLLTRALPLNPRWVICAIYMGDDFENAFRMTYGTDYWSPLRRGSWASVDADIWETEDGAGGLSSLREWLSRHSMMYRLLVHGPALGALKGALQLRRVARAPGEATTFLTVANLGIQEAFRPAALRDRLDQGNPAVQEGMRLTFELLGSMDRTCHEHGCQLLVLVIPTKESVFADHLLRSPQLHLRAATVDLIKYEGQARDRLFAFLDHSRIPYVDVLPALRSRVASRLYTRSDRDMHPSQNGYRVIGEAVAPVLGRR